MIKKTRYILILLLFIGCGKNSPCFKSVGSIITEERIINSQIRSIYLEDEIELVLTQSSTPFLSVNAGKNLIPFIETNIEGNKLTIKNNNTCNFLRNYKNKITVNLSTNALHYINYSGTESVSSTNKITVDTLEIETVGVGDFILDVDVMVLNLFQHGGPSNFNITGESNNSYLYSNGNGWFNLSNLNSNSVYINHNGSGDMNVKFINDLFVDIYNIGNVAYYGNSNNITIGINTGKGKLIAK